MAFFLLGFLNALPKAYQKPRHAVKSKRCVFGKTKVAELRCHAKGAETQSDDRYSANRSASVTSLQKAIIEKRLKEVCRLLADSTLTISEIAVRCGYRDANYLKNLFKRRYNMSMRDWRKQNSQK